MPGSDLIQSVLRATDAMDAIARSQQGLSVRELAELLNLKRPTVNNLLRTLAERRYVELRGSPRRYFVGAAVKELADLSSDRSLHHTAALEMRRLQEKLPQASFVLAEMMDDRMQPTMRLDSTRPGVIQRPRHELLHPYSKSTALAGLAFGSASLQSAIRQRFSFWEFGAHVWGDEASLDAYLAEARELGYTVSRQSPAVAAPVYDAGNHFVAALGGFFGQTIEPDLEALTQNVIDAAGRLSKPETHSAPATSMDEG